MVSPRGWIGRTVVGLFRPFIVHRGFVLVVGEDARWHRFSSERYLHKRVSRLVEAPWDVIEFEAIELVF